MKPQPKTTSSWTNTQIITAIIVVLVLGGVVGYLMHSPAGTPTTGSTARSSNPTALPPSPVGGTRSLDAEVNPLQQRLNSNPHDVAALTELGNIYFDNSQWSTAIGYYTRSLNEAPHNPDVRTDMGIAYYYSGDADRALKEFETALKDDPRHAQTFYNVGVVKLNGKNDPKGAVEAWQTLLRIAPTYPDRTKVESMIADAQAKLKK